MIKAAADLIPGDVVNLGTYEPLVITAIDSQPNIVYIGLEDNIIKQLRPDVLVYVYYNLDEYRQARQAQEYRRQETSRKRALARQRRDRALLRKFYEDAATAASGWG